MSKEHPILFSTPMVQAILPGTKTMTRRTKGLEYINTEPNLWRPEPWDSKDEKWNLKVAGRRHVDFAFFRGDEDEVEYAECPYGKVGDVLWVRESWNITDPEEAIQGEYIGADVGYDGIKAGRTIDWRFVYKASSPAAHPVLGKARWKPSIHMPKIACRIFLEITMIKVERLQDITAADAMAEGISRDPDGKGYCLDYLNPNEGWGLPPIASFKSLWQKINGLESWNTNPWVWVIEFKRK